MGQTHSAFHRRLWFSPTLLNRRPIRASRAVKIVFQARFLLLFLHNILALWSIAGISIFLQNERISQSIRDFFHPRLNDSLEDIIVIELLSYLPVRISWYLIFEQIFHLKIVSNHSLEMGCVFILLFLRPFHNTFRAIPFTGFSQYPNTPRYPRGYIEFVREINISPIFWTGSKL